MITFHRVVIFVLLIHSCCCANEKFEYDLDRKSEFIPNLPELIVGRNVEISLIDENNVIVVTLCGDIKALKNNQSLIFFVTTVGDQMKLQNITKKYIGRRLRIRLEPNMMNLAPLTVVREKLTTCIAFGYREMIPKIKQKL